MQDDALQDLEARVRKINGMATLSRSTYASVSVDDVLGIGGFDVSRVDEHVPLNTLDVAWFNFFVAFSSPRGGARP